MHDGMSGYVEDDNNGDDDSCDVEDDDDNGYDAKVTTMTMITVAMVFSALSRSHLAGCLPRDASMKLMPSWLA